MPDSNVKDIDTSRIRAGGRDLLSVALMDARNHTLHLSGLLGTQLEKGGFTVPRMAQANPPLWELGHIGWFQEWWIARNMQRTRGTACDPSATRLASIEASADSWWSDAQVAQDDRWALALPDQDAIKVYLLNTLETTLELLEKTSDEDQALYFYRLSLFHEDLHAEALITLAQTLGLALPLQQPGARALRAPLHVPATRW